MTIFLITTGSLRTFADIQFDGNFVELEGVIVTETAGICDAEARKHLAGFQFDIDFVQRDIRLGHIGADFLDRCANDVVQTAQKYVDADSDHNHQDTKSDQYFFIAFVLSKFE